MVVIEPGSPVQLLYATLVLSVYLLVVLKSAPFRANNEDWVSFCVVLVLVLDTLAGFALIMDQGRTPTVFNANAIGVGLIVMNSVCVAVQIAVWIVVEWKLYKQASRQRLYERCTCKQKRRRKTDINPTAVSPAGDTQNATKSTVPATPEKKEGEEFDAWDNDNVASAGAAAENAAAAHAAAHTQGEGDAPTASTTTSMTATATATRPTPPAPPHRRHKHAEAVDAAHEEALGATVVLSNHRRKLKKQTTQKVIQRRQAQILLRHTRGLRNTEIFKHCPDAQLKQIIAAMELKIFLGGEQIVTEGEPGNSFMVLVRGSADVYQADHGKISSLDTTADRRMIGERALVDDGHMRTATVIATGDYTQVLVLTREAYAALKATMGLDQKTDEKARRASRSLQAADAARQSPPTAGASAPVTVHTPPADSSGGASKQDTAARAPSFGSWGDDGDNDGATPTAERKSMIARPADAPAALQRRQQRSTFKSRQRRRAQVLLCHTNGLRNTELFREYSDDALKTIIESMSLKIFTNNQTVVKENDPGDEFFVIVKGGVDVFITGQGKVGTMGVNQMIGEAALVEDAYVRTATVKAVGDEVQCLTMTRSTFRSLSWRDRGVIQAATEERLRRTSMTFKRADRAREMEAAAALELKDEFEA